jgi:hypothetical protein
LRNGVIDIKLDSLMINGNREIVSQGRIKGTVALGPYVPAENKGVKMLAYLKAAATIESETESLAFLNVYLRGFHGMKIDGAGKLSGQVSLEDGKLRPETNLNVSARRLTMDLLSYRAKGSGDVNLSVESATPDTAKVVIAFGALEAFYADSKEPLLSGKGLEVRGAGTTAIGRTDSDVVEANYLSVAIPSVKVPDIRVYQPYLPRKWSFKLHGGQGALKGGAEITHNGFNSHVKLVSQEADVGLKDYRFTANLDMVLKADCPAIGSSGIDISGTYLNLENAMLSDQQEERSRPWHASLAIEQGAVRLRFPETFADDTGILQLRTYLKGKDVAAFLETGDRPLKIKGRISDLRWLNLLLKNPYNMAVEGAGEITAEVNLASGWLAPGTILKVNPDGLKLDVLDYRATGDGSVTLAVEKGGEHPDVNLSVQIDNALFKRRGEEKAFVENVTIDVQAQSRQMSYNGPKGDIALAVRIPSATVTDMSVYNRHLPPRSPFQFKSGKADLTVDIRLQPASAGGFVKLKTRGMQSRIDKQHIEGEITAEIQLAGGVPQNMDFDISGSRILLDRVRVAGMQVSTRHPDWYARLILKKGHVVWKKPTRVEVTAGLEIKDTRPLVAIMANQRGKHGWLEKTLTVENVRGQAAVTLDQEQIVIPYAFVGSEDIHVGVKGLISPPSREGIFYLRYKELDGVLKIWNKERNFDILGAKETYDDYSPGDAIMGKKPPQ